VRWSPVSEATRYELQEDDNSLFSSPTTVYSGSSTSKDISGRGAGTYYYRVRASNCRDNSGWSKPQAVTVEAPLPTAPTLTKIIGTSNNVLLEWNDNSNNEDGFKIERKEGTSGTYREIGTTGANVNAYADTGLQFGKVYCYRVRAYNSAGNSDYSNEKCATTLSTPILSSPPNGATLNTNTVTLKWNCVTRADGYGVEVSKISCGGSDVFDGVTTSCEKGISNLANGVYYWRVQAFAITYPGLSKYSECWSFTIDVVQPPCPSAPSLNSIDNSDCDGNYTVSWSPVSGATSYELQEDDNSSFSSPTTVYQGSSTSKYISGKSPDTYYYRVRAFTASCTTEWSTPRSVRVWPIPSTPTLYPISNPDGDGNYTVSWSSVSDATSYTLQEDDNPSFSSPITVYSGPSTSKGISGKSPGTYYYRVRASNCRDNSGWSKPQAVTVEAPPEKLDKPEERAEAVLKAIDKFFEKFELPAGFPKSIVQAIAAAETGRYHEWNNELVSGDWGRGVMQITTDKYVGAGSQCNSDCMDCSNRKNEGCKRYDNRGKCKEWISSACYRYYSNTQEGINRNVLDGLYVLQYKFVKPVPEGSGRCANVVDENEHDQFAWQDICWMSVVLRYNVRPYWKRRPGLPGKHNLDNVGENLKILLQQYYGKVQNEPILGGKFLDAHTQQIWLYSSAYLQVYDSKGRVTGLIQGEAREEIPNSIYSDEEKAVIILLPTDSYHYKVVGEEDGTYGLQVFSGGREGTAALSGEGEETISFAVEDFPITKDEVHQYTVDWDAFAQDGSGVTRQIDSNGDGRFEQTIEIQVPTASFTYSPESPTSGQTITFDATSSYDPDGEITSYKWDFGDGWTLEGETSTATHSYSSGGDYTVILTVRDNDGAINTSTTTITVTPIYEVYLPFILKNYP
jgi:hypothetical protein